MKEAELKTAIESGELVIGSRAVTKVLKLKKPHVVVLASNCPENIRKDINYYSKIGNSKVDDFVGTAKQLGTFCGKSFSISALAVVPKAKKTK